MWVCVGCLADLADGFLYVLRNGVEVYGAFVLDAVVDVGSCFVCSPSHLHAEVTMKTAA